MGEGGEIEFKFKQVTEIDNSGNSYLYSSVGFVEGNDAVMLAAGWGKKRKEHDIEDELILVMWVAIVIEKQQLTHINMISSAVQTATTV